MRGPEFHFPTSPNYPVRSGGERGAPLSSCKHASQCHVAGKAQRDGATRRGRGTPLTVSDSACWWQVCVCRSTAALQRRHFQVGWGPPTPGELAIAREHDPREGPHPPLQDNSDGHLGLSRWVSAVSLHFLLSRGPTTGRIGGPVWLVRLGCWRDCLNVAAGSLTAGVPDVKAALRGARVTRLQRWPTIAHHCPGFLPPTTKERTTSTGGQVEHPRQASVSHGRARPLVKLQGPH